LPAFSDWETIMNQLKLINPAETYEDYFVPAMFLPWSAALLQHAAPQPGERVLDVACGTGIVARGAAPLVGPDGQVTAVDMNPVMLAVARALPAPSGAVITWQEGNAMSLPFTDSSFDLVLCQHSLPFIPDRLAAVREIRRMLLPEGRAIVMVLQALAKHPVFEALMESVARHLSLPLSAVMTPFAMPDADELRALFTTAGFTKVEIVSESITARFAKPDRFVPLAVASSAAAVPAFVQLEAPARAALLDAVRAEVDPTIQRFRENDFVVFPMYAHIAVASV
jgi:ubiquinone/menaquinone biosynthesis C-methylase UbiE